MIRDYDCWCQPATTTTRSMSNSLLLFVEEPMYQYLSRFVISSLEVLYEMCRRATPSSSPWREDNQLWSVCMSVFQHNMSKVNTAVRRLLKQTRRVCGAMLSYHLTSRLIRSLSLSPCLAVCVTLEIDCPAERKNDAVVAILLLVLVLVVGLL